MTQTIQIHNSYIMVPRVRILISNHQNMNIVTFAHRLGWQECLVDGQAKPHASIRSFFTFIRSVRYASDQPDVVCCRCSPEQLRRPVGTDRRLSRSFDLPKEKVLN